MIAAYRTPRNARELAHAIQLFMLDQFGIAAAADFGTRGADLDVQLDSGDCISIAVLPSSDALAARSLPR